MIGYCTNCNTERALTQIPKRVSHHVKGIEIAVDTTVCVCNHCGEEVWNEEIDSETLRKLYAEYREIQGLLQPQQIKQIREKYGLSQVAFARILGFGDKTIARYENGSIQDAAPNNLLLLVQETSNFIVLYRHNKGKLSPEEIAHIEGNLQSSTAYSGVKYTVAMNAYYFSGRKDNVLLFPTNKGVAV